MTYSPFTWYDLEAGGTLVTASRLNALEQGVADTSVDAAASVKKGQTATVNNLYVSPTGSDSNTGVTVGSPFLTVQKAFDYLKTQGPILQGQWNVNLAAGVYAQGGASLSSLESTNRIHIKGPEVSFGVPTAILDGGDNPANTFGMILTRVYAQVSNIKFRNYDPGTATGTGFQAQDFSDVWLTNVHADGCSFVGVYVMSNSKLRMTGGIVENCQRGVRVYANTSYSVGYNSAASRVTIRDCDFGFEARDMSAGRLDYTDISNCLIGAWAYQGARFHPVQSSFSNCTQAGVHVSAGAHWYYDPNENLVFSGNALNVSTGAGSSETSWSGAPSPVVLDTTRGTVATHTGTLTETTIVTLRSVPAKLMNEPGAQLILKVHGVFSGAGDKSVRIRVNGTSSGAFASSTGSLKPFVFTARMIAASGSAQVALWEGAENAGNAFVFKYSTAIPFAPSLVAPVVVQGTLTDVAGTIEITHAEYSYLPPALDWVTA